MLSTWEKDLFYPSPEEIYSELNTGPASPGLPSLSLFLHKASGQLALRDVTSSDEMQEGTCTKPCLLS